MSASEHEPPSKRKPPIAVPLTLLALGATAVVVPILLLRRTRGAASNAVKDLQSAPPPPIQRIPGVIYSSSAGPVEGSSPPRRHVENRPEEARTDNSQKRQDADVQTVPNRYRSSEALYALQALGIATCIVGVSAGTGVLAVRWALGVQSAEEFAVRVRTKIQSLTPMLCSRIYEHHVESPIETEAGESEEWVWVEAAERLSRAYEEGGLAQWMAVAEKELEMEVNVQRKRRAQREGRPVGT